MSLVKALGSDFTDVEETLLRALGWLKAHIKPAAMLEMAGEGLVDEAQQQQYHDHLERMGYAETTTLKDKLYRQLLLKALIATAE